MKGVKTVDENEMEKSIRQFQRLGFSWLQRRDRSWKGLLEYTEQIEKVKRRGVLSLAWMILCWWVLP